MRMDAEPHGGRGRFRVRSSSGGHRALHTTRSFAPGTIVATVRIVALLPTASRYSLQLGVARHALIEPELLQFLNHSCDPNLVLDVDGLALTAAGPIEAGEELTLFYPSTEWEMAVPFPCHCGAPRCLGWIAGAAHLPPGILVRYRPAEHIRLLLETRGGSPVAREALAPEELTGG